jgi:hypothetical protein
MKVMSYCDEVVIITHNSTIYLTPPSFVIKHASLSSILIHHNVVVVAHRCPQSSTPEQKPITIIGDINIIKATQQSMYRIVLVLYLFCTYSVKSTEILYLFCKIYTNILYLFFCRLTRNSVHTLYISSQYSVPILFKTHYDIVSFCACSVRILYSIFCTDSVLKWPFCTYSVA